MKIDHSERPKESDIEKATDELSKETLEELRKSIVSLTNDMPRVDPGFKLKEERRRLFDAMVQISEICKTFYETPQNENSVRQMDSIMKIEAVINRTISKARPFNAPPIVPLPGHKPIDPPK